MPELPEVETVRRGLEKALPGAVIRKVTLRRGGLRVPFPAGFAAVLEGRSIETVGRRGKYLLLYTDGGDVLIAHLGMSGRFCLTAGDPSPAAHDHVLLQLEDGRTLVYNDARRFGLMTLAGRDALDTHPLLAGMGPEPLEKSFTSGYLRSSLLKRSGAVKTALLDQRLVAGIGNIYASEALFLAGVRPETPAPEAALKAGELAAAIRRVLRAAIASGGSSLRDFVQLSGETGYFQHRFHVYGRAGQPCFRCRAPVRSLRQAGRSTFFCPTCQK